MEVEQRGNSNYITMSGLKVGDVFNDMDRDLGILVSNTGSTFTVYYPNRNILVGWNKIGFGCSKVKLVKAKLVVG